MSRSESPAPGTSGLVAGGGTTRRPAPDPRIAELEQELLQVKGDFLASQQLNQQQQGQLAAERARVADLDQSGAIVAAIDGQKAGTVPAWSEKSTDISAELWIGQVERLQTVNKWTDEQTLNACYLSLYGKAATWYEAANREDKTSLDTLAKFKDKFLERFQKSRTAAESIALVHNLRQTSAESVQDFSDRVVNALYLSTEKEAEAITEEEERKGFNNAIAVLIKQHFVSGLLPEIKRQVEAKLSKLNTKEELLAAAIEIEAAVRPKHRVENAAMETSAIAKLTEELAALRTYQKQIGGGKAKKQKKKANQARQGANPGGARGGPPPSREDTKLKVASRQRWVFCNKCGTWGLHYADECLLTPSQISNMAQEDRNRQPQGKPRDRQF